MGSETEAWKKIIDEWNWINPQVPIVGSAVKLEQLNGIALWKENKTIKIVEDIAWETFIKDKDWL